VRQIVFGSFYAFRHRFHRIDTSSTARMPPPRRISCFETHVDHPQKWDFWIQHRRSAEKVPTMGKATPHPADWQPCGYNPIHQRGAIACPWYQSLRNRVGYFGGAGEILGLGFGSFFLCLVVFLFFYFCFYVWPLVFVSFWLYNLVFTAFFIKKLNDYLCLFPLFSLSVCLLSVRCLSPYQWGLIPRMGRTHH
jgi:hypothetical protein